METRHECLSSHEDGGFWESNESEKHQEVTDEPCDKSKVHKSEDGFLVSGLEMWRKQSTLTEKRECTENLVGEKSW